MNSNIEVHNFKISLKIKTPHISYISKVITKNQRKILHKNFGNFIVVYSNFTYIFFNTKNNILHCNVTKIKKYNQIYLSKKELKYHFPKLNIISTQVDNICATKITNANIDLEILFKDLVRYNSLKFKVNYNSQKFPGLFIKFYKKVIIGTLIIFKSGKINYVGLKSPNDFVRLDEWVNKWIHHV